VVPEQANRPTVASGLLAVPETTTATMPVVSYQHGTVFAKKAVPSCPDESMETRLMIAQFAGQGYLVVGADYFGKGLSTESDSYLVKASTQQACLDMLRSAQAVSAELKLTWGPLFLSGWSQGGWATMVFLNKLESLGIPVKAAATASAPNDLFAAINHWLHVPGENDAIYLPALMALQLNAYERYYALPGLTATAIKPEYQDAARDLYLNKITWEEASPRLPKHPSDMLMADFVAASSIGSGRYWEHLQNNQAYRWRSVTPLRSYYGDVDEVVPPFIATLPVGYQNVTGGAETLGIEVSKGNHRGAFVHAVAEQKKWFDGLLAR
jgi:pimeloyl-ACP methyl ester carboxylesterase